MELYRQGSLLEAQKLYKKVLKAKPKNPMVLQGLGQIELSLKNYEAAKNYFLRAVKFAPSESGIWNDLGNAYLHLQDGNGAAESFATAIRLNPQNVEAKFNFASLISPIRPDQALLLYKEVIQLRPTETKAYIEAASLLRDAKDYGQASQLLLRALEIQPENSAMHNQLGRIFYELKNFQASIDAFKRAILCDPKSPEPYTNLTAVLFEIEDFETGIEIIDEALQKNPTLPSALNNKGLVLARVGRAQEAINCYKKAISAAPEYSEAYINLANQLETYNKTQEAMETLNKLFSFNSGNGEARYNSSFLHFKMGHLETGWKLYALRFEHGNTLPNRKFHTAKPWEGEDLGTRTIMVWREQGIGDEFQLVRCLNDLHEHNPNATILYETEERLIELMQRSFPFAKVRVQQCASAGAPLNASDDYDVQIAVGNLSIYYRKTLDDFPSTPVYLKADPDLDQEFKKRIDTLGNGLKIGVCWRSGFGTRVREGQSLHLADFWKPVFTLEGCHFINLQYGDFVAELNDIEQQCNTHVHRWDDVDLKNDLDKVFAIANNCDLIITPTTNIAQVGGSLGIPTFVVHYEGYWPLFGTDKNPSFPTQRYFLSTPETPTHLEQFSKIAAYIQDMTSSDTPEEVFRKIPWSTKSNMSEPQLS